MKLQESALGNLITLLPEHDRYTYNHEGNAQALDHILASLSFLGQLSHFDVIHINSEALPNVRVSDHDPVYAVFRFD